MDYQDKRCGYVLAKYLAMLGQTLPDVKSLLRLKKMQNGAFRNLIYFPPSFKSRVVFLVDMILHSVTEVANVNVTAILP